MKNAVYVLVFILFCAVNLKSQVHVDDLHGEQQYVYKGLHDGNQIRTTFRTDGMIGVRCVDQCPDEINLEWPINSGNIHMPKFVVIPMGEVVDDYGNIVHIASESHGTKWSQYHPRDASRGDVRPDDTWRTMCALPGFVSPALEAAGNPTAHPAMSDNPSSWPSYWPDKMDDTSDPGWPGSWNGYFGKGLSDIDQESYFMADDYQNDEIQFTPDSTNLSRGGLGIRMGYRGLQWKEVIVDDVLFLNYEMQNIGTGSLNKMTVTWHINETLGRLIGQWCSNPDIYAQFIEDENFLFYYDVDNIGCGGSARWEENGIGSMGFTLLASPGNPHDGIDNDGDSEKPNNDGYLLYSSGKELTVADIETSHNLQSSTPIVLIDYSHMERLNYFGRALTTWANLKADSSQLFTGNGDTLILTHIGKAYKYWLGKTLEEYSESTRFNQFDDDLDGIIDESNAAVVGDTISGTTIRYLNISNRCINYLNWPIGGDPEGWDNLLIDESQHDGLDNDQDSGYQNTQQSSYNEELDPSEIDMLGMTALGRNSGAWTNYRLDDDPLLWELSKPGNLMDSNNPVISNDFNAFISSGYFSIHSQEKKRFSIALMVQYGTQKLLSTKKNTEIVYHWNFEMSKAPVQPTLRAVPGNGHVILYWDNSAEQSLDPILGYDFEGYRIYRATSPDFSDATWVTNAFGENVWMVPLVQYDLDNDIKGLSNGVYEGVQFYLGNDNGLQYLWVDNSVNNNQKYYYVITSYDRGDNEEEIPPTECDWTLLVDAQTGVVQTMSSNVAICEPDSSIPDYNLAQKHSLSHVAGESTGQVFFEVVDLENLKDNHTYQISFQEQVDDNQLQTQSFKLTDMTSGNALVQNSAFVNDGDVSLVYDGFRLHMENPEILELNEMKSKYNHNNDSLIGFTFFPHKYSRIITNYRSANYMIIFGEVGIDTCLAFEKRIIDSKELPSIPVNFKVKNMTEGMWIDVAFYDRDDSVPGEFSVSGSKRDEILFLEKDKNDSLVTTWKLRADYDSNGTLSIPSSGDTLYLFTYKPFREDDIFELTIDTYTLDIDPNTEQIIHFDLKQNYPNPFNAETKIIYEIPERGHVQLQIYDMLGRLVRTLIDENVSLGRHQVIWDGRDNWGNLLASGIYIYRIVSLDQVINKKCLMVK